MMPFPSPFPLWGQEGLPLCSSVGPTTPSHHSVAFSPGLGPGPAVFSGLRSCLCPLTSVLGPTLGPYPTLASGLGRHVVHVFVSQAKGMGGMLGHRAGGRGGAGVGRVAVGGGVSPGIEDWEAHDSLYI